MNLAIGNKSSVTLKIEVKALGKGSWQPGPGKGRGKARLAGKRRALRQKKRWLPSTYTFPEAQAWTPIFVGPVLQGDQYYTVPVSLHSKLPLPCTHANLWSAELNCSFICPSTFTFQNVTQHSIQTGLWSGHRQTLRENDIFSSCKDPDDVNCCGYHQRQQTTGNHGPAVAFHGGKALPQESN